jgi:predicted transcriptional regulator
VKKLKNRGFCEKVKKLKSAKSAFLLKSEKVKKLKNRGFCEKVKKLKSAKSAFLLKSEKVKKCKNPFSRNGFFQKLNIFFSRNKNHKLHKNHM